MVGFGPAGAQASPPALSAYDYNRTTATYDDTVVPALETVTDEAGATTARPLGAASRASPAFADGNVRPIAAEDAFELTYADTSSE